MSHETPPHQQTTKTGHLAVDELLRKLITGLGSGGFTQPNRIKPGPNDPPGQLSNLAEDLAESKNLYEESPEIVARLTEEIQGIVESGRSR